LDKFLRLLREGEGAVIDSGEIEVVEDAYYVVFFIRCFARRYNWFGGEVVLVLGLSVGIEKLRLREELTFFVPLL
jgi:hypothetical protein